MLNIPERSRRERDHAEGERWLLFVLGCFHSIFKPPELRVRSARQGSHILSLKGTVNDTQPAKPLSLQQPGFTHPVSLASAQTWLGVPHGPSGPQ